LPSAAGGTARPTTRLSGREQQAGGRGTKRIPPPEDHRRYRDESAAGSHLIGELVLIEREIDAAKRSQHSR